MSTSVENRILEMQFNNQQFERNIRQSTDSLDKLKKGLDLSEASDNLNELDKSAKRFNLNPLSKGVDYASQKLTAMGIIGVTALVNITNQAISTGKRLISAFTIDPVKMGFQEYETQINAVQTILANTSSKGTTLEQVNNALDELNRYADMTIYNFTEMTRNIGTFTAAGVDLNTSVAAIKGIANLAAVSGSTSLQASTAMYQLSQALAAGTVKLQDWNSVVNAGMGGQVFQDALKETADLHGIAIDKMIERDGSFRETLQHGWLTAEILTETLAKFTGDLTEEQLRSMGYTEEQTKRIMEMGVTANDAATKVKTFTQLMDTLKEAAQSGWTQTWEILIGDFEEAKASLTKVSDTFSEMLNASAEKRNNMLQSWKNMGGRDRMLIAIKNSFDALMSVVKPVKEAFDEIFPAPTAMRLLILTNHIKDFTSKLVLSKESMANLKDTAKGVFAIFDIALLPIKALIKGLFQLVGVIAPVGGGVLEVTGSIGRFIVAIDEALKSSNIFEKVVQKIVDFLTPLGTVLSNVTYLIGALFKELGEIDLSMFDGLAERISAFLSPISTLSADIGGLFDKISEVFASVVGVTINFGRIIGEQFDKLKAMIHDFINNLGFDDFLDIFTAGIGTVGAFGLIDFLFKIKEWLEKGNLVGLLTSLGETLEGFQDKLKAEVIMLIAKAIALLAASLFVLSLVPEGKVIGSIGAITAMFTELMGSIAVLGVLLKKYDFKGIATVTASIIPLSIALLILAGSVLTLGRLDWSGLLKGLTGVGVLLTFLVAFTKSVKTDVVGLAKTSAALIIFGLAIEELTRSVRSLSSLDVVGLAKGLIGVGALLYGISIFLNKTKGFMNIGTGAGLALTAVAIATLTKAIQSLASLETEGLQQALMSVVGILTALSLFVNYTAGYGGMVSLGIGLIGVSTAMNILSTAIERMGAMSYTELEQGLLGVGLALVEIALATKLMPPNMIAIGAGMVILSSSLYILYQVINNMSSLSWEQVAIGLVTLGGALGIISLALTGMTTALPGAAAMLVVASAIAIFIPSFIKLSSLSFEQVASGMAAFATVMILLRVVPIILLPVSGALITVAGAVGLFGLALISVGAGITLFSVGLTGLVATFSAAGISITAGIAGLLSLIPEAFTRIGEAIVALITKIGDSAVAIAEAFTKIVSAILDAAKTLTPKVISTIVSILKVLLETIRDHLPEFMQAGFDILIGFLQAIGDNIGKVTETALYVIFEFLDTIMQSMPQIVDMGFKVIINFVNSMAQAVEDNMEPLLEAFGGLAGNIIDGLVKGLKNGITKVINVIKDIGTSALETLKDRLGIESPSKEFAELGEYSVEGYVMGIEENQDMISDSLNTVMDTQLDKFDSNQEEYRQIGVDSMTAMASGYTSSSEMLGKVDFTMQEIVNQFKNWAPKFTDVGTEHILAYVEGFSSKSSLILGQVDLTMQEVMNQMASWGPKLSGIVGNDSVTMTGLMNGIQNDSSVTLGKVDKSMQEIIEQMKTYLPQFEEIGKEIITNIGNGIQNNSSVAMGGFDYIAQQILNQIHQWFPKFFDAGTQSIISYVEGLQGNADYISEVMAQITAAQQAAAQEQTDYQQVGEESIAELAEGFRNKSSVALGTIDYLMQEVINQIRAWFPKFQDAGKFLGESYSQGVRESIEANLKDIAGVTEALGTNAIMGMEEPVENFEQVGQVTVSNLDAGISGNSEQVVTTMTEVMKNTQNVIIEAQPKFQDAGRQTIGSIVNGYKDRMQLAFNTMRTIVDRTLGEITSRYNEFYSAGSQLVDGFIMGIRDNIERAAWQAAEMAIAAYQAAMDALAIQSPSRKMQEVGMYTAMGFAEGIRDNAYLAEDQSSSMALTTLDRLKEAMSGIDDYISNDVDLNPTITPVLDLSNISKNKTKLNQLLKGSKSIGANLAYSTAQTFDKTKTSEVQTTQSQPQNVQFVQNNYSPKALSRLEIYRQTKNQFMAYKEGLV